MQPLARSVLRLPLVAQAGGVGEAAEGLLFALLALILVGLIGGRMATKLDKRWLPGLVTWAFVAKLMGAWGRYYMVTVIYQGGDAFEYHAKASVLAQTWRAFAVPVSSAGNPGTAFTEIVAGLIYAPYVPTMLGAFLIFATLAYFGQLLFYAAFRPWAPPEKLKLYALAVLLFPSMVFWPSSLGKDALMVLFLGLATYGASRLLRNYDFTSLFFIAPGLYLAARIRPHVASLLGLAMVLAAMFGKAPKHLRGSPKRLIMLGATALGAVFVLATFSTTFNVSIEGGRTTQDPAAFLQDVSAQTSTGGSEVQGSPIGSPAQLPGSILRVLFRPLIFEAHNAPALLAALESTALLALVVWRFPTMWRRKGQMRERPFLLMCFFYTGGFILGFSAVLNLGILARQRVQLFPLFFALLIGLGWEAARAKPDTKPSEQRPVAASRRAGNAA